MILLLVASVFAQSPAHYSSDGIAQNSQVFRSYSERLTPQFERLQSSLGPLGQGIEYLERGVLLLGDKATDDLRAHLESSRRTLNHAYLVAQAHVTLLETDSQTVFESAMTRAIAHHAANRDLVECSNPRGLMAFGPSRGQQNCEGESLNAAIAATMDADEALKASVESILSVEWPVVEFEPKPWAAVALTGESGHVQVTALAQTFLSSELGNLEAGLERDLVSVQAKLESDSTDETSLKAAWALRSAYEAAVGEQGAGLWLAMEKPLSKKKQFLGLCPNPAVFGGCPGEDLTEEVLAILQANRKFRKVFP
jgi:hypothetical protein